MDDTIVAIATTVGESAINIIKISGQDAIQKVNNIFKGSDLTTVATHTINYGFIMDNNTKVDEVLVSVFKAPKSYTKEDVVEINCHGGVMSTNKILLMLLNEGIRLAEPGEFLKRAFLNGRIDLIEAESVQDLITAKTEQARKMSLKGIDGSLSRLIKNLREELLTLVANIEVNIDYPEYEDAILVTNQLIKAKSVFIEKELKSILDNSKNGLLIKNGLRVGIIGKPNVGKSSILNALINEEKAIVTDVAGTTRDIVEGTIVIDGIELNLVDTAGIRNTNDKVEKMGVDKSYKIIDSSDLVLFILDNSKQISEEDKKIIELIKNKKSIIIINKVDLPTKINKKLIKNSRIIETSAVNKQGIDKLKKCIKEMFRLNEIEKTDYTYLSNSRQISLVEKCLKLLGNVKKELKNKVEVDLLEIDIKNIWSLLGEIIGETYKDELLDEIFSKFCLGK